MVKNTKGGTGTKGLARKHQTSGDSKLRLPGDVLEKIACVTKMLGNGMCEIYTNDDIRLIGHIRNKFRGKQKRNNMLSINNIVLIGIREWENPSKNCDILSIYESNQVEQLRNIPGIKIADLLKRQLGYTKSTTNDDDLIFTDDTEDDVVVVAKQRIPVDFVIEETEEIDLDDI